MGSLARARVLHPRSSHQIRPARCGSDARSCPRLIPTIDDERRSVVPLPEIMKAIKGASSHQINHRPGRHGSIWQEESFDRVLRSSEKLDEKIVYILQNPVRCGLVREWHEYSWIWYRERENPYTPSQPT